MENFNFFAVHFTSEKVPTFYAFFKARGNNLAFVCSKSWLTRRKVTWKNMPAGFLYDYDSNYDLWTIMYPKHVNLLSSLSFCFFFDSPHSRLFFSQYLLFSKSPSYSSSNSFCSMPPSAVACAFSANTCRFNTFIIFTNWEYLFCSHFHIAISNLTGCFN